MARKRIKTLSWTFQFSEDLKSRLRIGESKYDAKKDGSYKEFIYSWSTYNTYLKQLVYFGKFIKENHSECKKIADISSEIANSYLQHHIDKGNSAYTIKLIESAILKVTKLKREDLIDTPRRERKNIKRSRGDVKRKFDDDLIKFCKGTGLRRCELEQVRGNDLREVDGKYYLEITRNTKGGRHRMVEITGDIKKIVELCQNSGEEKLFGYVPKNAPIHGFRGDYCKAIYKKYERHHQTIAKFVRQNNHKEVYICKKDKNDVYDRRAMLIASENLGHSRVDVMAINYLY